MAWTYAALKEAEAALGIDDPGEAAAALNAQTVIAVSDIATSDARAVLLLSGEWFKVKQLAKTALNGTAQDQAVAAADICVDTMTLTTTLHTSDDAMWATMQPMIGALQAAGVVSAASVAAWNALRMPTVPKWQPTLDAGHIQTARAQP
jgi:hypothetical protein